MKRQKGVFAIEFALGFIVLFMFTMLIFETCRITYICAVLDYATAEAARDARVQLRKNTQYEKYIKADCSKLKGKDKEICLAIKNMNGDHFTIWFYSFINNNAGVLWSIFTSKSEMYVSGTHYKNFDDLVAGKDSKNWKNNSFSEYKIFYQYKPLFFKSNITSNLIIRSVLVIDEFERHKNGQ